MTFVAFSYKLEEENPVCFLGVFDSVADLVDHLNETSSGNQPFDGHGLDDLPLGKTMRFPDITVFVTRLHITKKAKNIYITNTPAATTAKAGVTVIHTVPLMTCPMCGSHTVAATLSDVSYCSYACATGT
jgi:hypothetical protein